MDERLTAFNRPSRECILVLALPPRIFRLHAAAFVALAVLSADAAPQGEIARASILKEPARNVRTFAPDWSAPLGARVKRIPDVLLRYVQAMDRTATYEGYEPTPAEHTLITDYLSQLPASIQQVMRERVVGIYFIRNFKASAWCGLTLDPDDASKVYLSLAINPETLHADLSAWMTRKEASAFLEDGSGLRVQIDAGKKYQGLMYVLLHEGAHLLDIARSMTPYVSGDFHALYGSNLRSTAFTREIWMNFAVPFPRFDYPARAQIRFYGLNGGTRVSLSEAPRIYESLQNTPFVSLYASTNWADDFADLFAYTYLTEKLGQPYEVSVWRGDVPLYRHSPFQQEQVRARGRTWQNLLDLTPAN